VESERPPDNFSVPIASDGGELLAAILEGRETRPAGRGLYRKTQRDERRTRGRTESPTVGR